MLRMLEVRLPDGRTGVVIGGPFREIDKVQLDHMLKIKVAVEQIYPADVSVDIVDFNVPTGEQVAKMEDAVRLAAQRMVQQGRPIGAGCAGGVGRTGLFMACLLREVEGLTAKQAIEAVRMRYYSHAVETTEQREYVASFRVSDGSSWKIARPPKAPPDWTVGPERKSLWVRVSAWWKKVTEEVA